MILAVHLVIEPLYGRATQPFLRYFHGHNLLSCGWMWLTSFMGQPVFVLCLICVCFVPRDFLSLKRGPSTNSNFSKLIFKISFEGHNQNLQRNPDRFKTWMECVRQILIKLEMSSIWGFLRSSFLCRVINANTVVATQRPLKHTQSMIRAVWYCGPVAHCCCSCYDKTVLKSCPRPRLRQLKYYCWLTMPSTTTSSNVLAACKSPLYHEWRVAN